MRASIEDTESALQHDYPCLKYVLRSTLNAEKAKRKLEEKAGHSGDVGSKKDKLQEVIPCLVDKDKVRAVEKDTSEEEVMEVYAQVIHSDQEFPQPTPPGPQVIQP